MADNLLVEEAEEGRLVRSKEGNDGVLRQGVYLLRMIDGVETEAAFGAGLPTAGTLRVVPAEAFGYVDVAAEQEEAGLGTAGALGDFISHVVVFPVNLSPGDVTLHDGETSKVIFTGGTNALAVTVPFVIDLRHPSKAGGFAISTGADVSVRAVGRFTDS